MHNHFDRLDGWRGISILLVLAAHLLPLGPSEWKMNHAVAGSGMAVFFIMSGFLITHLLMMDNNVRKFLIRRFARIVPLAWLVITLTFLLTQPANDITLGHFFFYYNILNPDMTPPTSHFWSLCVEMQFYVGIALLVVLFRGKAFWMLPLIGLGFTLTRWILDLRTEDYNFFRVDEILAGCMLALIMHKGNEQLRHTIGRLNPLVLAIMLVASSHSALPGMDFFRPYIAMLMVGCTLFADKQRWYDAILKHQYLVFIAGISYALYIIHGGLRYTWLGEGDSKIEIYLKRPLLIGTTFILAWLSTRYYERFWIQLGRKLSARQPVTSQSRKSLS